MSLSSQQIKFTKMVAELISWAYCQGYGLTFGEAMRTPEQQAIYIQQGKSKTNNSKHLVRLAVDLNLFIDGEYKGDTASYKALGEYWESLDPDNVWGGRFSFGDGNHFQHTK